jgi:plasmid stability protein
MSKMIQIRNVPDALHRKLKVRAAQEGVSLSELLLAEARRTAERPSLDELRQCIAERAPVSLRLSPAEAVRQERDAR